MENCRSDKRVAIEEVQMQIRDLGLVPHEMFLSGPPISQLARVPKRRVQGNNHKLNCSCRRVLRNRDRAHQQVLVQPCKTDLEQMVCLRRLREWSTPGRTIHTSGY